MHRVNASHNVNNPLESIVNIWSDTIYFTIFISLKPGILDIYLFNYKLLDLNSAWKWGNSM